MMDMAIVPPIGGENQNSNALEICTKRGRPKTSMRRELCESLAISVRSFERARVVLRYGVPELQALVHSGQLDLGPAEYVARWSHDDQREHCAKGAAWLRRLIPLVRKCEAEGEGA